MIKLHTILSLSLLVAISNAQSNLYNINNDIIDYNNGNGQQTHKLALHNHKTIINSRYINLNHDISNRRLKNRNNNNNNDSSKRDDIIAKPNKRNKREKREDTKIGDDIAIAMTEDYDRKHDSSNNKRVQRKKNESVAVSGNDEESGDKRRHKDKKVESLKVEENVEEEVDTGISKKKEKKRTAQHTAQSTKKQHTLTTTADTTITTNEHQKRQKRVDNEMINIFQNRISNINGSKQYKESIAGHIISLDFTMEYSMKQGKYAKQTKRHSKSIKSVKSKVDKRPTMSPSLEGTSITPTLESSSPTPTMESSESPTPTSSSESPTPTSTSESPTMDESCELYPGQDDPCPDDKYCKTLECMNMNTSGICTDKPINCIKIYKPVCGCDGITYGNSCEASEKGVNVAYEGECDNDTKPPISSSPTSAPSHSPSHGPTTEPTIEATTMAPTYIPDDNVTYFQSFEQSFTFPYIDTELTQDDEYGVLWDSVGDMIWVRSDEESVNGKYSLRNPMLETDEMTRASSSVTMLLPDTGTSGTLHFSLKAGVQMPYDWFQYKVDGGEPEYRWVNPMSEFRKETVEIPQGQHLIEFQYEFNPQNIPAQGFPPDGSTPDRTGIVYLDDVYFVPNPPCDPLEPNPYDFEEVSFPVSPWSTTGEGDNLWSLTNDKAFSGTASLRSPVLEDSTIDKAESNAVLQVCDDFDGGYLQFQYIASVQAPLDLFFVSIDGEEAVLNGNGTEWTLSPQFGMSPGRHTIEFSYRFNPYDLDSLPLSPPEREGVVWIDKVEVVSILLPEPSSSPPSGSPTEAPSHGPSSTPTSQPTSSPSTTPSQAPTESSTVMESVEPTPTSSPVSITESPVTEAPTSMAPTPKPTYGPNRCIGEEAEACEGNTGDVGPGSCINDNSCLNNTGDIGSGSCRGPQACEGNTGKIGSNSCIGVRACYKNNAVIEDSACTGDVSCSYDIDDDGGEVVISPSDIIISNGGCNGTAACAGNTGNVSSLACNAEYACYLNSGSISPGGCGGLLSCFANEGDVGSGSCLSEQKTTDDGLDVVDDLNNYPGACQFNNATVGNGACNSYGACYANSGEISDGACSADEACLVNSGSISSGGCNGLRACYVNEGDIGEAACSSLEKTIEEGIVLVGDLDDYAGACMFNRATIGSSSCSLFGACYGNSFESLDPLPIGSDSCIGNYACWFNMGSIGNGSCRADEACCGNEEEIVSGTCNTPEECSNCTD